MNEEQDLELQDDNSETYEESDSTGEDETAEEEQGSEQQPASKSETSEQRNSRIKRQVERAAKKEGISVEEYLGIKSEKGSKESTKEEVDEKYLRLDLKTEGIKSKKEQDTILDYIREKRLLGHDVDVETALKSMVVKEELTRIRNASATPRPSARPGQVGGEKTLEQYAQLMMKGRTSEVPLAKQREIRKKRMLKW